eukprot:768611-Hanusia_phi.AAC.3
MVPPRLLPQASSTHVHQHRYPRPHLPGASRPRKRASALSHEDIVDAQAQVRLSHSASPLLQFAPVKHELQDPR